MMYKRGNNARDWEVEMTEGSRSMMPPVLYTVIRFGEIFMKQLFNTTLKAGLVAAMMLGAGAPVMAQQNDKPAAKQGEHKMDRFKNMTIEERVEKRLAQMDKQLDLTDAQVAQLRPILTEDIQRLQNAREAVKKVRDADNAADKAQREAARAEMKAQMQTTKDRIAAVLTPEQREKAAAHLKEMRANVRENMKARHEKMQAVDGEQRQQIKKQLREEKKLEKQQNKLEKKNAK
jgi:Spy/CpxP family protein refolding chaperone